MGSDSPVSSVDNLTSFVNDVGSAFDSTRRGYLDYASGQWGKAAEDYGTAAKKGMKATGLAPPTTPPAKAAPPPPSLGSAASIGVNTELAHEQRMAAASTILTGGAGLTDEPTTASRVLLGS